MLNALATVNTMVLTETASGLDITLVDSLLEVTRTILGMFGTYPLNLFLVASIVTIGIGIFTQLKNS